MTDFERQLEGLIRQMQADSDRVVDMWSDVGNAMLSYSENQKRLFGRLAAIFGDAQASALNAPPTTPGPNRAGARPLSATPPPQPPRMPTPSTAQPAPPAAYPAHGAAPSYPPYPGTSQQPPWPPVAPASAPAPAPTQQPPAYSLREALNNIR